MLKNIFYNYKNSTVTFFMYLITDIFSEVVYIGSIHPSHFSIGKLMLENGKHLLIEKPLTMNLKQTKALIEIARREKRFLMEVYCNVFAQLLQKLFHLHCINIILLSHLYLN